MGIWKCERSWPQYSVEILFVQKAFLINLYKLIIRVNAVIVHECAMYIYKVKSNTKLLK